LGAERYLTRRRLPQPQAHVQGFLRVAAAAAKRRVGLSRVAMGVKHQRALDGGHHGGGWKRAARREKGPGVALAGRESSRVRRHAASYLENEHVAALLGPEESRRDRASAGGARASRGVQRWRGGSGCGGGWRGQGTPLEKCSAARAAIGREEIEPVAEAKVERKAHEGHRETEGDQP